MTNITIDFTNEEEILQYLNFDRYDITKNTGVAVALSGGADSLFLCLMLDKYCRRQGIEMIALIIDHDLRAEAAAEAAEVHRKVHALGIRSKVIKADWGINGAPTSNIQAAARDIRYRHLFEYCDSHGISHLFVGHTQDDQAETILMRLERGSGVSGMCGIYEVSERADNAEITLIRPLIKVKRSQIEKYLHHNKISYISDPSNHNQKYARVRIRQLLHSTEDYDLILDRIALLADNMQRTLSYLKQEVEALYKRFCVMHPLFYLSMKKDDFICLHEEMQLRLMQKILSQVSGNHQAPRLLNLRSLIAQIGDNSDLHLTFSGTEIVMKNGVIYVFREFSAILNESLNLDLSFNQSKVVWDGRFCFDVRNLYQNLNLKARDKVMIRPLGEDGYRRIKESYEISKLISTRIYHTLPSFYVNGQLELVYPLNSAKIIHYDAFLGSRV